MQMRIWTTTFWGVCLTAGLVAHQTAQAAEPRFQFLRRGQEQAAQPIAYGRGHRHHGAVHGPVHHEYHGEAGYYEVDGASAMTTGAYGDLLYPYDAQEPWLHGYWQEMPVYGGFHRFKPYNYKHVLSQSQTAAGWGMSPTMPYSQQFWHRYEDQAAVEKYSSRSPRPNFDSARELYGERPRSVHSDRPLVRQSVREERHLSSQDYRGAEWSPVSGYGSTAREERLYFLQHQIEQQSRQLEELHRALQDEYEQSAPPRSYAPAGPSMNGSNPPLRFPPR